MSYRYSKNIKRSKTYTSLGIAAENEKHTLLESRLASLRRLMKENGLQAYIVPSEGDHNEEYTAVPDRRREYLTGFTGSVGEAVVTEKNALLWTDARYFIQAQREFGPSWALMKKHTDLPVEEWIRINLSKYSKVGVDPKKLTYKYWLQLKSHFDAKGIIFVALEKNLIDEIWTDRPAYPTSPLFVHDETFSGEHYTKKLKQLRAELKTACTDLFVTSSLDEIAWLTNLRGYDIPMTPVFMSYLIVTKNLANIYIHDDKISNEISEHLSDESGFINALSYSMFWEHLESISKNSTKIFLPDQISYAIYSKVNANRMHLAVSPLLIMKAVKNNVEVAGSRNAHVRDAVALCQLFSILEQEIPNDVYWDELKVFNTLLSLRAQQKFNKGPSFPSTVAFGTNGALPHYVPTLETNLQITTEGLLTIDSGGQYLDGTIDTTRVLCFGTPTELEKTIYTKLLQGVADLATTVFPDKTKISDLDIVIRRPLLQSGYTFEHGTTHGTGVFLSVHEATTGYYHNHFIGSQEPGYYRKDGFGMRLENLVVVEPAKVQSIENPTRELLAFSPLTLVPYELKLVNVSLMDKSQINWLNEYHEQVKLHVGDEMILQGKHDLYQWLLEKTAPVEV